MKKIAQSTEEYKIVAKRTSKNEQFNRKIQTFSTFSKILLNLKKIFVKSLNTFALYLKF